MKTTIEEINGKLCTIIRKPFDAEWVRGQLAMGIPVLVEEGEFGFRRVILEHEHKPCLDEMPFLRGGDYSERYFGFSSQPYGAWTPRRDDKSLKYIVTILPALKRKPTAEDAEAVYEYMAKGLYPHGTNVVCYAGAGEPVYIGGMGEITHAFDAQGNRHEIALEGNEDANDND